MVFPRHCSREPDFGVRTMAPGPWRPHFGARTWALAALRCCFRRPRQIRLADARNVNHKLSHSNSGTEVGRQGLQMISRSPAGKFFVATKSPELTVLESWAISHSNPIHSAAHAGSLLATVAWVDPSGSRAGDCRHEATAECASFLLLLTFRYASHI